MKGIAMAKTANPEASPWIGAAASAAAQSRSAIFEMSRQAESAVIDPRDAGGFPSDWRRAIAFVWIPHLFAVWGITTVNFLQHDGCDKDHPVNHSRNFVGATFNWFTLNNGFHGIHHETPGLHWSLAPAAHAEKYAPTIHPELDQPSLFGYMFKAFIYPGKRVTYDGKPLMVQQKPDSDWVIESRRRPIP